MATKEKALRYAQDAANRKRAVYVIRQSKNGQWLFVPARAVSVIGPKDVVVNPKEV